MLPKGYSNLVFENKLTTLTPLQKTKEETTNRLTTVHTTQHRNTYDRATRITPKTWGISGRVSRSSSTCDTHRDALQVHTRL